MFKYMKHSAGALALVIAIAGVTMLTGQDARAQSQFFVPCATLEVVNPAPGATSEIKSSFGIGVGENCVSEPATDDKAMYNFGGVVNFTPTEFDVKKDADVADGTETGTLLAQTTLGLLNNPCTNQLLVSFKFYEATINQANGIDPLPPGTANRMKPLGEGTPPAGALKWPNYLTKFFADNGGDLTKLRARYIGVATVIPANNLIVILNFMVFEPGATLSNAIVVDPRLGYPSVTVLQDPTGRASAADFINDFCSPLLTQATITGGVRKNPTAAGTYNFTTFVAAQRDADGDGFENSLDTCPLTPNIGNPRAQPDIGDPDKDGIDSACDPFPNDRSLHSPDVGISFADEDDDGWMNRNDNCAIVANNDQLDTDSDGIGDVCDPNPQQDDPLAQINTCLVIPITIGSGGPAAALNPADLLPCNPNAVLQIPETPTPVGQTPTPTLPPGATPRPTTAAQSGGTGVGSGPVTGVGSLSPAGNAVPDWAVLLTAVGFVGLLGGASLVSVRAGKRR